MHVNRTRVLGQKVGRMSTHRLQPRGSAPKDGRDLTLNVLTERMQLITREKYHHEEHEGHKVKSGCKILRDLRGRQILLQVTGADGLAEQIRLPQLSFGVWLGSWEQTSRGPWSPAEGQAPSTIYESTLLEEVSLPA